ncbi:MAG: DUF3526 domain-containing protein [Planctomycetes bacterium]|nr:DUF3526 domain-containing protein [Planctomycetota bacterium]MCP4770557.1 DUF3526 domain-containing protein [Planctomycetota bacterium]MCP4860352.1 DUF3526 domain-containing protein [Planctomycetota bacterium]
MIRTLFLNEWRALLRDGRGAVVLAVGVVLALISSWTSASTHARQDFARNAATDAARGAWDERTGDSPHSRAHYGDYVFRPSGPLAKLDSGLEAVTGRVIYTEGHRQNSAVHKPQQEAASLLRYDRLEPSTVLQLLAPLVLVLAGFGVVSSERESGRLKLLWLQGVQPMALIMAKTFALWTLGAALCLLVVGAHLVFAEEIDLGRTVVFLALHFTTLWVVAAVVAAVSAWSRRPGTAATILLSCWVLGGIVMPRLAAMAATVAEPLPGRDAFQAAMEGDREQGMDGHNPRDQRRMDLEQQVLDEYGVSSRSELPVNLGGLIMQADEEYGAQVWDKHFGELEEHLQRQYSFAGFFSFLNPLQATDRLSMAVAGTGLTSHLDFLRETEDFRREMVRKLNEEDAFGVHLDANGKRRRTTTQDFYTGFEAFHYEPLSLGAQLSRAKTDIAALIFWLVGATAILGMTARRLHRGGVL